MKIITNLPRLPLGFSAVALLFSCVGTDVNEPYLSVNSDPGDGAGVNQVSAELQTIGLAGAESDANQTTSGMAPFLVGDGLMDQAVGTIDPSSWGELMSGGGVLLSMVDLGEEPRRPLRLSPNVGQVESLKFEMAMNMGTALGSLVETARVNMNAAFARVSVVLEPEPRDAAAAGKNTEKETEDTTRGGSSSGRSASSRSVVLMGGS